MKLIEGMKLVKELLVKADDLRKKVAAHSAHLNIETAVYPDQKKQVREWLQAHEDIMHEIARMRVRVAKTNLATSVTIKVGDNNLAKCITEWIARRKDLAPLDAQAWAALTDRHDRPSRMTFAWVLTLRDSGYRRPASAGKPDKDRRESRNDTRHTLARAILCGNIFGQPNRSPWHGLRLKNYAARR